MSSLKNMNPLHARTERRIMSANRTARRSVHRSHSANRSARRIEPRPSRYPSANRTPPKNNHLNSPLATSLRSHLIHFIEDKRRSNSPDVSLAALETLKGYAYMSKYTPTKIAIIKKNIGLDESSFMIDMFVSEVFHIFKKFGDMWAANGTDYAAEVKSEIDKIKLRVPRELKVFDDTAHALIRMIRGKSFSSKLKLDDFISCIPARERDGIMTLFVKEVYYEMINQAGIRMVPKLKGLNRVGQRPRDLVVNYLSKHRP